MIFHLTQDELADLIYYVITEPELPPERIRGNLVATAHWKLAKAMEKSLSK